MRRLWAASAAIVVCLPLGGLPVAGQESSEQPLAASTTIGFSSFYTDTDFFGDIRRGAQEAASTAGVELIALNAYGDPAMQADHLESFVADGVDAIIIVPVDPVAIVPSVEAANAAGIPVLAVDRTASGGMITSLIASDNVAAARMAGEALFEVMGGSGKVVEIQGDMAVSTGKDRSEGFQQALAAAPGITLAVQAPAEFSYRLASQATRDALEKDPDITGVFAANLDMLEGATQVVASAGMSDQVSVAGFDTSPTILTAISDGSIDATVAQQPLLMGQRAVEAALAVISGEPVEPFIPVETILVTQDNVDGFLAGEAVETEEAQAEAASPVAEAMAPAVFTGGATCGFGPTQEWLTSDPRVTGPCSIAITSWGSPDTVNIPGAVGNYTVAGPEGDWTGAWMLLGIGPAVARNLMVLEGTEAYEGWVVLAWAGTPDSWQEPDPWDLQGVIYEGSAPSLQWPEG